MTLPVLNNRQLILRKSDPEMDALELLFSIILEAEQLIIMDAVKEETDQEVCFKGTANLLNHPKTTVQVWYSRTTGKIKRLQFSKPVSKFAGIDLNKDLPLLSFPELQSNLHLNVPNDGDSTIGITTLELTGLCQLTERASVPFSIRHPGSSQRYTIEIAFSKEHPAPSLQDLTSIFGNKTDPHGDLKWLPDSLQEKLLGAPAEQQQEDRPLKPLSLKSLNLTIDLDEQTKLVNVDATLAIFEEELWQIIPGVSWLGVGGLSVELDVDYPLEPDYRFPILRVTGMIQIGEKDTDDGKIAITARWPDFAISGGLIQGSSIHVGELLRKAGLNTEGIPDDNSFLISQLSFNAEPFGDPKLFSFFITIDNIWSFTLPGNKTTGSPTEEENSKTLDIRQLSLRLHYSSAKGQGFGGQFSGAFNIAGVDVFLTATHRSPTSGWQFDGRTGPGQSIPIGTFQEDLHNKTGCGDFPGTLKGLLIENLHISLDTQTKGFLFSVDARFPADAENQVRVSLTIELKRGENNYSSYFSGKILINPLQYDLIFSKDKQSTTFLASYQNLDGGEVSIGKLVRRFNPEALPEGSLDELKVELKDALFVYNKQAEIKKDRDAAKAPVKGKFLFAVDVGAGLNLSNLPLIGEMFNDDQTLKIVFQPVFTSAEFNEAALNSISRLTPPGGATLKFAEAKNNSRDNAEPVKKVLAKGLNFSGSLIIGERTIELNLPVKVNENTGQVERQSTSPTPSSESPTTALAPNAPSTDESAKWFDVQKSLGPVTFQRVGVRYADNKLWFMLDASLSAAGLTISLDGLAAGADLKDKVPVFDLRGLGIDFRKGPLEIGGAFLRTTIDGIDEYSGMAIIRTEQLSISAIGAYTWRDDHPSMFLYAVLDYPLGGPAFFFITGLAAGFGYNRSLLIPEIDKIVDFPLVAQAIGSSSDSTSAKPQLPKPASASSFKDRSKLLTAQLNSLREYIPPAIGQYWLAVGIKFTSFKMVNSFALLAVQFGKRLEIDLLGISSLVVPTPEAKKVMTPLAEVELALRAVLAPDEGYLKIEAQLTRNSYILTKDCHLTGGFAFYCWFKDQEKEKISAGDFVITLGGYHPSYHPPAHYPDVPRVGFNWQVSKELSFKGGVYFALTPSALMAGVGFEAVFESGIVSAWFRFGADFLISWKPYHYEARIFVELGVAVYLFGRGASALTLELGADLQVWGPEFSGIAKIKVLFFTIRIKFGANAALEPEPIDWQTFRSSFLPNDDAVCGVVVQRGLIKKTSEDEKDLGLIDPVNFSLLSQSAIPIKEAIFKDGEKTNTFLAPDDSIEESGINLTANTSFGIGSMDIQPDELHTTHSIRIFHNGQPDQGQFKFLPHLKHAPAGLWGSELKPDLNAERLIKNTIGGFEIIPAKKPEAGETRSIENNELQFSTHITPDSFAWEEVNKKRQVTIEDQEKVFERFHKDTDKRDSLLSALGFESEQDIDVSVERDGKLLSDIQVL